MKSTEKLVQVTTYSRIVGAIIVALRKDAKIEQEEMANELSLSQSAWSRVETGTTQITVAQLAQAARVLKKRPWEILRRVDVLVEQVERAGVAVEDRIDEQMSNVAIIIGAAALIGLAIAAIKAK